MEEYRFSRVEHGEYNSSVTYQRSNTRGEPGHEIAIEVIQNIPHEHGIEGVIRIQHRGLQKPLRAPFRRHLESVRPGWNLLRPLRFLIEEVLPGGQQILGVDLEAALDEESDCSLPGRPKIQQMAMANSFELPEKFLEAIGLAPALRRNTGASGRCAGICDRHRCGGMDFSGRRMPLRQSRNLAGQ